MADHHSFWELKDPIQLCSSNQQLDDGKSWKHRSGFSISTTAKAMTSVQLKNETTNSNYIIRTNSQLYNIYKHPTVSLSQSCVLLLHTLWADPGVWFGHKLHALKVEPHSGIVHTQSSECHTFQGVHIHSKHE